MEKDALIANLKIKGFKEEIINAFSRVKREKFVPDNLVGFAYDDIALPIEADSTISQPSTIAFMLDLLELEKGMNVLEIGSGSGYVLALISEIVEDGEVYGLEINRKLAVKSAEIFSDKRNVKVFNKDGSDGLVKFAPFDRILISASCQDIRIPVNLTEQLKENGVIVAAVGQSIFKFKKESGKISEKEYPGFAFIPLRKEE